MHDARARLSTDVSRTKNSTKLLNIIVYVWFIRSVKIQLIIITPSGDEDRADGINIRRSALDYKIPLITTIAGAKATAAAIEALKSGALEVKAIQSYY